MAKKVIRLTESDIMGIVKNVINEMYECTNDISDGKLNEGRYFDDEDDEDLSNLLSQFNDEIDDEYVPDEEEMNDEFPDEPEGDPEEPGKPEDEEEEIDDLSSFEDSDEEGEDEKDLYSKRYEGSAEDSWYVEPPKDEHKYDEDNEYTDGDVVYYENIPIEKKDGRFHMTIEDGFKGDNGDCPRIDVVGSHIADVKGEYDRLWNKFYYKDHYKYADQMVNSGKGQIQIDDTEPLGQGTRMGDYTVLVDLDKK
jgi:hypothetical protein